MYCTMYLDRVNISMTAKQMMQEFSLSHTQIGFAFSAFFWPYMIGQLFGGWFAKKIGARMTLILCASLVAITTFHRHHHRSYNARDRSVWPGLRRGTGLVGRHLRHERLVQREEVWFHSGRNS